MPEIITFGEVMLRLAPPHFQRLEQARSLDLEIGGAEFNTAAGLARLGHDVTWVSLLPDSALGRLILQRVRETGVNTDWVQTHTKGRAGIYYLEFGASPRASSVTYDRTHSSITFVEPMQAGGIFRGKKPGTFDWESIFEDASWFHITGITPALSDNCAAVTLEAMQAAKQAGLRISMDPNFRSKLWTIDKASRTLTPMARYCDLLIASVEDANTLFHVKGETFGEVAPRLAEKFQVPFVASTRRESDSVWRNRFGCVGYWDGQFYESPIYDVEIVDRLGSGDAMASGLISGLLQEDFVQGIEYGAALGALQHTIPGDVPWFTTEEVVAVIAGKSLRIQR